MEPAERAAAAMEQLAAAHSKLAREIADADLPGLRDAIDDLRDLLASSLKQLREQKNGVMANALGALLGKLARGG